MQSSNNNNKQASQDYGGSVIHDNRDHLKILVVGNAYLDEFVEIPTFPKPDGKYTCSNISDDLGGSATNCCCGFLSLLADHNHNCDEKDEQQRFKVSISNIHLHAVIGADDIGVRLMKKMQSRGINLDNVVVVKKENAATGRTIVLLTPDGVSTKIGQPGVSADLDKHLLGGDTMMRGGYHHIHLASVTCSVAKKIIDYHDKAAACSTTNLPMISMDIGAQMMEAHDQHEVRQLISRFDFVFMNEIAVTKIYGVNPFSLSIAAQGMSNPTSSPPHWIRDLKRQLRQQLQQQQQQQSRGANIIVTLGAQGAYMIPSSSTSGDDDHDACYYHHPGFHVTNVKDTTGAGDAFASAFIAFYHLAKTSSSSNNNNSNNNNNNNGGAGSAAFFTELLGKGNLAASIKIQSKGGCNGHPSVQEINKQWLLLLLSLSPPHANKQS